MTKYLKLIEPFVFLFLPFDIFPDRFFTPANCRYKVSPGPEVLAFVVPSLPHVHSGNMDVALAFMLSCNLRHYMFERYRYEHVSMIFNQVPLEHFRLFLESKIPEYPTEIFSKTAKKALLSASGNPD